MLERTWSATKRRSVAAGLAGLAIAWTSVSWAVNDVIQYANIDVYFSLVVSLVAATWCLLGLILLGTSSVAARLTPGLLALFLVGVSLAGVGTFIYLLPAGALMTVVFFISMHEIAYP